MAGKKWVTASVIVAASLLLTVIVPPPRRVEARSGKVLSIPFHAQSTQVWCWAASIAMVVEYFKGQPIRDCEVLSLYDRSLNGPGLCCAGDRRCIRGSMPNEIGPILGNVFGIRGMVLTRSLSWSEIVENIDANKPIIAWVWNSQQSAHVVVISGYSGGEDGPRMLTVLDPLRGRMAVPYVNFAMKWGPAHDWNISWIFRDTRSDLSSSGSVSSSGGADDDNFPRPTPTARRVPCTHRAHPLGDTSQCIHGTMHPFDPIPCQHLCFWGPSAVPCHPNGDMAPCRHVMHPLGDITPCTHPQHPLGDLVTDDDDDSL